MTGLTIIPAVDDTNIIDRNGDIVAMVVAWQYIQSNMVFPVFAIARSGLRKDEAIWYGNGKVEHPDSRRVFEDNDAWVAWAEDNVKEDAEQPAEQPVESKPAAAATTKPAATSTKPAASANGDCSTPIKFGTKTYSTKSYWVWPDMKVIFEIEGGSVYPVDPRVEKIKRDEFAQLKRDGFDKIDPASGVIPGTDEEHGEDQSEPDTGTDEDEDMDVV